MDSGSSWACPSTGVGSTYKTITVVLREIR